MRQRVCKRGHVVEGEDAYVSPTDGQVRCYVCIKDRTKRNKSVYRARTKSKVYDLLGRSCSRCGFNDERALQIDHVNGGGYQERQRIRDYTSLYVRVLKHPEEYQVLCANCNWIKRVENGETGPQPHTG